MEGSGYIPDNRPVNDAERELVLWLLRNGVLGAESLIKQVEGLRVESKCSCGCPTVHFEVSGSADPFVPRILANFHGKTENGEDVGVILWTDEGRISSLEVYGFGDEEISQLPLIDTLDSLPEATEY